MESKFHVSIGLSAELVGWGASIDLIEALQNAIWGICRGAGPVPHAFGTWYLSESRGRRLFAVLVCVLWICLD